MNFKEIGSAITRGKDKAVAFGKKKYDAAKPKVTDALDSAKKKAQKAIDDNQRIQAVQARAHELQKQAAQGIAAARQTIQHVQENPSIKAIGNAAKASGTAAKVVGETAWRSSQPRVNTAKAYVSSQAPIVGNFLAAKAHDAGNFVGAQAADLRGRIGAKALDVSSNLLLDELEKPESWTKLRTNLAKRIQTKVNLATQTLQTPQHIMEDKFGVENMSGVKKVGAEVGIYALDRATVTLGWATSCLLNTAFGLEVSAENPINPDRMSHALTGKVIVPTVKATAGAMGTIYERVKARYTPLPPAEAQ